MRTQLAAAATAALLLAPAAHAAPRAHTLTLVLDRSGQAEVDLPAFQFQDGDAAMTDPARGEVGYVFEREGEDPRSGPQNWVAGVRVRLADGRVVGAPASTFRAGNPVRKPHEAGRYLLSATSSGGGRAVVRIRALGLLRDVTVRLRGLPSTVQGGSARLDTLPVVGANGAVSGRERVSRSRLNRVWGMSGVDVQYTGTIQGVFTVCVVGLEEDCDPSQITQESGAFPGPTEFDTTGFVTPDALDPSHALSARQNLTALAPGSGAYGYGILINAPLPRTRQ